MTGEISLRGFVLPVGGIREKCFAANRNGIKRVILSTLNKNDVEELPKEIKNEINFLFCKDIIEVMKHCFHNVKLSNENKGLIFDDVKLPNF
jgi:ATP-dependent Lon protease